MLDENRLTDKEEITELTDDCYILIDSPTQGTRKISVSNLGGGE